MDSQPRNHKVHDFTLSGHIAETGTAEKKIEIERNFEGMLRDEGFVPILDLDPRWDMEFDFEVGMFKFNLTLHMGEQENAWLYEGISNGVPIEKPTQNPK